MTPLDDELRDLFHERADTVRPAADPLRGVESRARGLRRRRSAGAALASAAAVVAIAVAVPTGLSAFRSSDTTAPGFLGGSGSSAPASGAPAPATEGTVLGWGVQRDAALAERMSQPALDLWQAQHPGADSPTLQPLFARADGISDVLIAQVLGDPAGAATIVAVTGDLGTMELYYDAPTPTGTTQVSAVVPASSGTGLVIVTDPTRETRYSVTSDGEVLAANVRGPNGELALPEGTVPDRLALSLTDGGGAVTYTGPPTYLGAPDSEPGPASYATAPLDWGTGDFGTVVRDVEPLVRRDWEAAHPGRTVSDVRFLVCCAVGPEPSVQLSQILDTTGAVWDYATLNGDGLYRLLLDRRSPKDPTHVALTYQLDGASTPQTLVVADPGIGTLAYAADGVTFVDVAQEPAPAADGADGRAPATYRFARTGSPDSDAIRMVADGSEPGAVHYQGPLG